MTSRNATGMLHGKAEDRQQATQTMTNRRRFFAAAASAAPLRTALAQGGVKEADFLFVQNASGMLHDKAKGRLTLTDVSPVTVFFTDRLERIAGNMSTRVFVPFWSEGKDSFAKDNPNANLSMISVEMSRKVTTNVAKAEAKRAPNGVVHARPGRQSASLFFNVLTHTPPGVIP